METHYAAPWLRGKINRVMEYTVALFDPMSFPEGYPVIKILHSWNNGHYKRTKKIRARREHLKFPKIKGYHIYRIYLTFEK